jgi:hypothetical protein
MRTISYNGQELKVAEQADGFAASFGADLKVCDDGVARMSGNAFEKWSPHAKDPNMPEEIRLALHDFVGRMDRKYGKGNHDFRLP